MSKEDISNETQSKSIQQKFMYSIPYFFIKNEFNLTSKKIKGKVADLLYFVPMGKQEVTYSLKNISKVSIDTEIHMFKALFGLFLILRGTGVLEKSLGLGIVSLLIGIGLLIHSRRTSIVIRNNDGETILHPISMLERDEAKSFVSKVNDAVRKN